MEKTDKIMLIVLLVCFVSCKNSAGPTVSCNYNEEPILPGLSSFDASATIPFDEKYDLTGFDFVVEHPAGEKNHFHSDDGKLDYDFGIAGKYKISVVAADTSGVKNQVAFIFEITVLNPFEALKFDKSFNSSVQLGSEPIFSGKSIENFGLISDRIVGYEWELLKFDGKKYVLCRDKGTGLDWNSYYTFLNTNEKEDESDYQVVLTVVDKYGNQGVVSGGDVFVIDPQKPVIDFALMHFIDGTSGDKEKVSLEEMSPTFLYENEIIEIDASKIIASSLSDPSIIISSWTWNLYKKKENDGYELVNTLSSSLNSDFIFELNRGCGSYQIEAIIVNSIKESQVKSVFFEVLKNIPKITQCTFSTSLYEGSSQNLKISCESMIENKGSIKSVKIDYDDDKFQTIYKEDVVSHDGVVDLDFLVAVEPELTTDYDCSFSIFVTNDAGNESELKHYTFTVLDNNPVTIISYLSDVVPFGDSVSIDITGSGSKNTEMTLNDQFECSFWSEGGTPTIVSLVENKYSFVPEQQSSEEQRIYYFHLKASNLVAEETKTISITAVDTEIIPSFLPVFQNGKNNFYENQLITLDASRSQINSNPMDPSLNSCFVWTVLKDNSLFVNVPMVKQSTQGEDLAGLFELQLIEAGVYDISLTIEDEGVISKLKSKRIFTVLDNTPREIEIIATPFEVELVSLGASYAKKMKYKFSFSAISPDGFDSFNSYWFFDKIADDKLNADCISLIGDSSDIIWSFESNDSPLISLMVENNTRTTIRSLDFQVVDFTSPEVANPIYYTNSGNVNVTWSSSLNNESDVTAYRVQFDSEDDGENPEVAHWIELGNTENTYPLNPSLFLEEKNYLFFVQEQKFGFWSESAQVDIIYDTTAPAPITNVITLDADNLTNDGSLVADSGRWSWSIPVIDPSQSAREGICFCEYTLDDPGLSDAIWINAALNVQPKLSGVTRWQVEEGAESLLTLTVRTVDNSGNRSAAVLAPVLTVDCKAPSAPIVDSENPVPEYINLYHINENEAITFYWSHNDPSDVANYQISINNGELVNVNSSFLYAFDVLPLGSNKVSVYAYDAAGNVSDPFDFNYIKDITAPAFPTITVAVDSANEKNKITLDNQVYLNDTLPCFSFNAVDNGDSYQNYRYKYVDSSVVSDEDVLQEDWTVVVYQTGTQQIQPSMPISNQGVFRFWVEVQDEADNWSSGVNSEIVLNNLTQEIGYVSFYLDTLPPQMTSVPAKIGYALDPSNLNSYSDTIISLYDEGTDKNIDFSSFRIEKTTIDTRSIGIAEDVLSYDISDALGNRIEYSKRAVDVQIPVAPIIRNGNFEHFVQGTSPRPTYEKNRSFPESGEYAGWYMQDNVYYRRDSVWVFGTGWTERGSKIYCQPFRSYEYVKDGTWHFAHGPLDNSGRSDNGHCVFFRGSFLYKDSALESVGMWQNYGKICYGKYDEDGITIEPDFKVFKDVTYKISGWVKILDAEATQGNCNPLYFKVKEEGNGTIHDSGLLFPGWNYTNNTGGHFVEKTIEFTAVDDGDITFIIDLQQSASGDVKDGKRFIFDDFSIEIANYPGKE